jgi:nicotinamidase-related amidase
VREVAKEFPSACGIHAYNAIQPTRELFALARAKRLPVIYTTTETRKEVNPAAVHATNRRIREIKKDDYEIYEAFRPEAGDLIIYKERASGFFGTPLVAHLTRMGIDSLIVCGESTSGCVRASVVDAYSYAALFRTRSVFLTCTTNMRMSCTSMRRRSTWGWSR